MNYGLIYTISFATLRNESCTIEIEKEDYVGEVMELIPAGSPFTVEIDDDDFAYVPTRFSTANIRVVGSDYLQHLYSTSYQQYRVTFKRDGIVTWCGFIKPELYTQDYSSALFELEIECQSAMSTLEFIPYKQMKEGGKDFVSLWNLVKKGIELSNARYNAVYIPYVYSKSESDYKASTDNVLSEMTVSEQDFFDEDDKAMTNKEVLEEICKLLNWTCVDWKGELYFVDMDYQGDYRRYSSNLETWEPVSLPGVLNVQKAWFAGNDHTLDLVPGFNKVTVKTSNYNVGKVFPEEDFDKLEIIEKYKTVDATDPNWPQRTETTRLFLRPDVYGTYHYVYNKVSIPEWGIEEGYQDIGDKKYEELDAKDKLDCIGSSLMKLCGIKFNDGVPESVNYDFENLIYLNVRRTLYHTSYDETYLLPIGKRLLRIGESLPCAAYLNGAISINMSIKPYGSLEYNDGIHEEITLHPIKMYFILKIGDYYYNGTSWVREESQFDITFDNPDRSFEKGNYIKVKNTKTIDMPYNGMEGHIIPIDSVSPIGSPELYITGFFARGSGRYDYDKYQYGCYVKDIDVKYQKKDENVWESDDNSDRYYENVLNEDYINELDEIEFKISSYNNDGACYSKVMLGDKYLEDNLYSAIEEKQIRPEEQLIRRIVNRYSDTHIKLTQEIQEVPELTPITRLSDNFMVGKVFINTGGTIDYKMGKFRCIMVEA